MCVYRRATKYIRVSGTNTKQGQQGHMTSVSIFIQERKNSMVKK